MTLISYAYANPIGLEIKSKYELGPYHEPRANPNPMSSKSRNFQNIFDLKTDQINR